MIGVEIAMGIQVGGGAASEAGGPDVGPSCPDALAITHMLANGVTLEARRALLGLMLTAAARTNVTQGSR